MQIRIKTSETELKHLLIAWLAFFNMIPISVLDGRKVMAWSRRVYGVALGIAIVVLVMSIMI
ncbi:hypothetical protein CW713_02295 [Methanophagales archaeon]|nr:MAG: hypothetical protein CW713_02295 [Methanophagales archaeon]